jgi:hypothetical protein
MSENDFDIDSLIKDLRSDPEKALTLDLTDEQLLTLQARINPYARLAGPAPDKEKTRLVAACFTNLREDYMRRFVTTAMVGFVMRMAREWETPVETRRWTPPKIAKKTADKKPFSIEELEQRLAMFQATVVAAKAAKAAVDEAVADAKKYDSERMTFTEEEVKAARKELDDGIVETKDAISRNIREFNGLLKKAEEADGRLHGIMYTATLEIRNAGISADHRLGATEKAAMKFKNAWQVIEAIPDRHQGLLPGGQQEVPKKLAAVIVREFLENYFEFDPDAHVRQAYEDVKIEPRLKRKDVAGLPESVIYDPFDPYRIPIKTLLAAAPPQSTVPSDVKPLSLIVESPSMLDRQRVYNTVCHLLRDPAAAKIAKYVLADDSADPDRVERWTQMMFPVIAKDAAPAIPPQDTFHRFEYYTTVNMEAIREITSSIYPEKVDLDFAISLMDVKEGTAEELEVWKTNYRDQYQDRVVSDIKFIQTGGWTLAADFKANRERVNVYNKQTTILEDILTRHEQDRKLGGELMRKRVKRTKAKNIEECGPDAQGLSNYKHEFPTDAPAGLSGADRRRLEKAKGNLKAARELEYIEGHEEIVRKLKDIAHLRSLDDTETATLKKSLEEINKAKEMLDVPDGAIQIDVWGPDAETGEFGKTKFYSESESMSTLTSSMSKAARAAARGGEVPENPLDHYPEKTKDRITEALVSGAPLPALAPFASKMAHDMAKKESEATEQNLQASAEHTPEETEEAFAEAVDAALK